VAEPDTETSAVERTTTLEAPLMRAPKAVELHPGSVLDGRHQIEAAIGEGGSGTVFRAWDRVLGEAIAIKILHPDRALQRSWIKRLAREVKVARAIRHPNVCRVFDLGHGDGHWYVTMELATAGSLRRRLADAAAAARPLATRLDDARALCAGLAAIHAVGITHRDVTPQNVLCMADGRLVLSDFGLAIAATESTTIHGGTPSYMPPETAMGERADQRSDVWQLGAILHELVFGRRAEWVRGEHGLVMKWPVGPEATPVQEELARLCGDCLAQDPAARPPTAMAVAGRLAAAEAARPRTAVERAWLRARRLGRRYRRVAMAAAAVAALAGAARAVQAIARPPLCRAAEDRLRGVWDPQTKALVRHAFDRTGKSYAMDTFWGVNRLMEQYTAAWRAMYTEACEATHVRGEQSAEVLDLRMSCLADRLAGARALSQVLVSAGAEVVDNAVAAAGALGTLERCADARLLRAVLPPPDARVGDQVARIRAGIADAKAQRDAGNMRAAAAKLDAMVTEARGVGYDPLLAEALEMRGDVRIEEADNPGAMVLLKEAALLAEASRHDEVKANAASLLVLATARRERFDEADDWAAQADATLKRIGGHERMRAWLETDIGTMRLLQRRGDEALLHSRRALALKQQSGASAVDLAFSLNNIALVLDEMGRLQEALGYAQRAVADLRHELGDEHPIVGVDLSNEGEILVQLGRQAEARAAFERALAIEERSYGKDSANLGYPLTGLGESYLRDHQPTAAVAPLQRALAIRQARESDKSLLADTSFALARALWDGGGDRRRALALAEQARNAYGQQAFLHPKLEAVRLWLGAHRAG
jgi:tetratricopeptide (TPR) repeat protein